MKQWFQSWHVHTLGQDVLQSTLRLSTHTQRERVMSKVVPNFFTARESGLSHTLTYLHTMYKVWSGVGRARGACKRITHISPS